MNTCIYCHAFIPAGNNVCDECDSEHDDGWREFEQEQKRHEDNMYYRDMLRRLDAWDKHKTEVSQ